MYFRTGMMWFTVFLLPIIMAVACTLRMFAFCEQSTFAPNSSHHVYSQLLSTLQVLLIVAYVWLYGFAAGALFVLTCLEGKSQVLFCLGHICQACLAICTSCAFLVSGCVADLEFHLET